MKVIRAGYIRREYCDNCRSLLEFDIRKDVKLKNGKPYNLKIHGIAKQGPIYIDCPICKHKVDVSDKVYNNDI